MSMTKIAEITAPGGTSTIQFSSIPQTYTDLLIVSSLRSTSAVTDTGSTIVFNGSSTGYSERLLYGNGSGNATAASRTGSYLGWCCSYPGSSATASTFSSNSIYITNYSSTNLYKSVTADNVMEQNATYNDTYLNAGVWANTSAITSILLTDPATYVAGSVVTLYGVSKVPSQGIKPKATGGDVYQNGAYTYHVFASSGTFTPTAAIPNAEMLIVAGGAGGGRGNNGGGGGGGAGAVINLTSQSMTTTSYTVTVGAGGGQSTSGSDSSINGFTVATGGSTQPGLTGGGGIGGSSGNGFAGGAAGNTSGGGGGGATGAGSDYNSGNSNPGPGGPATYAYSVWTQATNTGYSDGFAGGGGGGSYWSTVTQAAGGGATAGIGGKYNIAAGSASANSGSGGGGNDRISAAGSGGSGIIIIRYA